MCYPPLWFGPAVELCSPIATSKQDVLNAFKIKILLRRRCSISSVTLASFLPSYKSRQTPFLRSCPVRELFAVCLLVEKKGKKEKKRKKKLRGGGLQLHGRYV